MQRLFIAGNVGKDAELRHTTGGDAVLGFTVAVDNGKDKPATWYDAAIWGKRGEAVASYIRKGMKITLIGRPTVRVHEGKPYLGISVDDFTFQGGGKRDDETAPGDYPPPSGGSKPPTGGAGGVNDIEDEIPFAFNWLA